jgi:hypothetical protein
MGDHNPSNPVPTPGHQTSSAGSNSSSPSTSGHRTTANFQSANPHTPNDGPPPQTTTVSQPPIPIAFPSKDPASNAG